MDLQLVAVLAHEALPAVALWDGALLVEQGASFVGHLEKQEVGDLLDVIPVAHPVVSQDVGVVPDLIDYGGGRGCHQNNSPCSA